MSWTSVSGTAPKVAVFGAGAVGCFFGAKLAEAGVPVTLIGRPAHVEAIRRDGLVFESAGARRRIAMAADTRPDAVHEADLVLFCVKARDTDDAAGNVASLLRPDAVVVSLQNGVDNVPRLRKAGIDALGAVVYVACSMAGPGHLLHAGRGDLVLGEYGRAGAPASGTDASGAAASGDPSQGRAARVAQLFERAGVPCRVDADVRGELWTKLAINCAYNAISALSGSRYGAMIDDADVRALMRELVGETIEVATADGVAIEGVDAQFAAAMRVGEAMRAATSSMQQDLSRGRLTEIDSLNGFVAARGLQLGVAIPANRALATLVRLLERTSPGR